MSEWFDQVGALFKEAVKLPREGRDAFLTDRCAGDDQLRGEVEALLEEDDSAGDFLERPALCVEPGRIDPSRATPDRIGGYRILGVLGVGGMGVVYEAEQDSPKRPVALKVISSLGLSTGALRRFEHESEVLGRLRHPGIAQIYEAGTAAIDGMKRPFFAMEIVRGEPITSYADRLALSTRDRLRLVERLCVAVQHAHQKGVIHRDLKPANVLVDEHGEPKVLDFGIARATDSDVRTTTMRTSAGELIGTLAYMSPEQASGDPSEIDTRSDVYAIGVIAYELLTGRLPLELGDRMIHEAVRIIREQEPRRITQINPRLRGDVDTITAKALEKERTRRYQTAAALGADIERYLTDQPILARPPSAAYQLRKFASRHKPLAAAGAAVALSLVAATAVSTVFAINEARQRKLASSAAAAATVAAEEESRQRARAEKRFADVRALANSFLFTIHDEIQQLPGSTNARRALVETGLKYLDSLAQEAGDDPELLAELAEAYGRIGDILGNPRRQNLGDTEGAREAYRMSIELHTSVTAMDPAPEPRIKLATAYRRLGTLHLGTGQTERGVADLGRAQATLREVLALHPDNAAAKSDLASAISLSGVAHGQMGRMVEALEGHLESLRLDSELAEVAEDKDRARRLVAVDHNEVGAILVRMDRLDEAASHFDSALAVHKDLAERNPLNVRHRRDLSISHHRIGSVHLNKGEFDEALADYEAALGILRQISEDDPADTRARGDYTIGLEKIGDALLHAGRHERALDAFRRCAALRGEMRSAPGGTMATVVGLAVAVDRCGDCLAPLGRLDEAVASYSEAHALAIEAVGIDPRDALAGTVAVMTASKCADLLAREGREPASLREACAWYRKGLAVLDAMTALDIRPLSDAASAVLLTAALNDTLARLQK